MGKASSILSVLLSKSLGLLVFLLFIAVANLMVLFIVHPLFLSIVSFLNSNLLLIIALSIVFLIHELFDILDFPMNLPGPLFGAGATVIFMIFAFNLADFVYLVSREPLFKFYKPYEEAILILVFVITLLAGYLGLMRRFMFNRKTGGGKKTIEYRDMDYY